MSKKTLLLVIILVASSTLASGSPGKRIGPRMIYDPVDQRIILYGGAHWQGGYTFYGELWSYEYETDTWTALETSNDPPPRFNAMLAYIPGRHQLFLFGGWSTNDRIGDTWIFDFESSRWTELHPGNQPSRRSDSSIAYDPENDVVVLYSGYLLDDSHSQDTWIYSFEEENWIQRHPDDLPLGQYGHYMVYAESTGQLLMYPGHWCVYSNGVMTDHGYGGNIWEYDVVDDSWIEHRSTPTPPGRYWGNIVYDSTEDRMILFGGHGAVDFDDTWTYGIEDGAWEKAEQGVKPSKRGSIGMAYDPINHVVVLFGGFSEAGQSLGDTWILDCETLTWHQPETSTPTTALSEPDNPPEENSQQRPIPGFPVWSIPFSMSILILANRRTHRGTRSD